MRGTKVKGKEEGGGSVFPALPFKKKKREKDLRNHRPQKGIKGKKLREKHLCLKGRRDKGGERGEEARQRNGEKRVQSIHLTHEKERAGRELYPARRGWGGP